MNNTDRIEKKLDALIDALGFDVTDITEEYAESGYTPSGDWKRSGKRIIDYKLTKRPKINDIFIDNMSLTQCIINIVDHRMNEDIYRFIYYSKEIIDAIVESGFFSAATEIDGGYLMSGVRVLYEKD